MRDFGLTWLDLVVILAEMLDILHIDVLFVVGHIEAAIEELEEAFEDL